MHSSRRLRLGKLVRPVKDLLARAVEAHPVVPSGRNWNTVCCRAVTPAELNRHGPVRGSLCGGAVYRIGVLLVRMEIAVRAIHAHRPKPVDRNFTLDGESMNRPSVVLGRHDG